MTKTLQATIDRADERFVIDYGNPSYMPARMVTFEELAQRLSSDIEDRHYGADFGEMTVYRYVPGSPPQLEPFTLTCVQPAVYDENDWAYPVWEVAGPDGVVWAQMRVRLDGRA